jgi:hypothetical protein
LKHEHQQCRRDGNAGRSRELELRIQLLVDLWGFDEVEEEVRHARECSAGRGEEC